MYIYIYKYDNKFITDNDYYFDVDMPLVGIVTNMYEANFLIGGLVKDGA
jgi:hypothetical protein